MRWKAVSEAGREAQLLWHNAITSDHHKRTLAKLWKDRGRKSNNVDPAGAKQRIEGERSGAT